MILTLCSWLRERNEKRDGRWTTVLPRSLISSDVAARRRIVIKRDESCARRYNLFLFKVLKGEGNSVHLRRSISMSLSLRAVSVAWQVWAPYDWYLPCSPLRHPLYSHPVGEHPPFRLCHSIIYPSTYIMYICMNIYYINNIPSYLFLYICVCVRAYVRKYDVCSLGFTLVVTDRSIRLLWKLKIKASTYI